MTDLNKTPNIGFIRELPQFDIREPNPLTQAYLKSFGLNPHLVSSGDFTDRGYFEYPALPGGSRRPSRGSGRKTWKSWPAGLDPEVLGLAYHTDRFDSSAHRVTSYLSLSLNGTKAVRLLVTAYLEQVWWIRRGKSRLEIISALLNGVWQALVWGPRK